MIAELIATMAGHSSALFVQGRVNPVFHDSLHPGEIKSLESLGAIAMRYSNIKSAVATGSASEYISSMLAAIRVVLREYETLVVRTEARVLQRDDAIVASGSFVPLSSLMSIFSVWDAPFAALESLITHLTATGLDTWAPGPLIDLLLDRSRVGVERISDIMSSLALSVQRVWQSHLTAYLIHGALSSRDPFALPKPHRLSETMLPICLSEEARDSITYIGRAVSTVKAAAARGHNQPQLPRTLAVRHTKALGKVLPQDRHDFDVAVMRLRADVSEWLWATVLTRKDVDEALESLTDYFLLRNGEFCVSLIREIERLKLSRLTPRESSRTPGLSIIREQDLSLALLRASLGTSAQDDPSLSKLRFTLPTGPLRPFLTTVTAQDHPDLSILSTRSTTAAAHAADFSTTLLGTPLEFTYDLTWPLDLLLTSSDLRTYSSLFAYFSSVRHTHMRVLKCWTSLSNAQRVRRKWVHYDDGGKARRDLLRCGWGVVREMLWFLDALWAYLMSDVVDSGYMALKANLGPAPGGGSGFAGRKRSGSEAGGSVYGGGSEVTGGRRASLGMSTAQISTHAYRPPAAPSVMSMGGLGGGEGGNGPLDFSTLRRLHNAHLHALVTASLLSNEGCMTTLKGILELCEVFAGSVERWGGDILPDLLWEGSVTRGTDPNGDDVGEMVQSRREHVQEVNEARKLLHSCSSDVYSSLISQPTQELNVHISTFYAQISSLLSSPHSNNHDHANTSASLPNATLSLNRYTDSDHTPLKNTSTPEFEARRKVERLLLKMDFNGGFSRAGLGLGRVERTRPVGDDVQAMLREAGLA